MKKSNIIIALLAGISFTCMPLVATAQSNWIEKLFGRKDTTQVAEAQHPNLSELTVDENLLIPEIGKRQKEKVCKLQATEAKRLSAVEGIEIELTRDDEVIHITIAASRLFAPNETTLLDSSDALLRSLLPCLRTPDYYHVLLVMHSDNTGNESYNYALTTDRVSAIYDWMEQNGGCVEYVVPYAAGSYEPKTSNNTIAGRAKNRRLEIYLIPAEAMLKK
ncbi:MAG: OmpA family protein [Bacteroidaceae bacterium]|nr:OmpA family protein [Bacteroidaceae bacterium]